MKTITTGIAIAVTALLPVMNAAAGDGPLKQIAKALEKGRHHMMNEPSVHVRIEPRHRHDEPGAPPPHVCRMITERYWVPGRYETRHVRRWVRDCHGGHYEYVTVRDWIPGRYETRLARDPHCKCQHGVQRGHRYGDRSFGNYTRYGYRSSREWSGHR